MPDTDAAPDPLPDPPPPSSPRRLLDLWAETGVVLLVCVVPLMFTSALAVFVKHAAEPFLFQAAYTVVRSAGSVALVLFVVGRSGEPFARFGMARLQPGRDLFAGFGTFVVGMVGYYVLWVALATTFGSETLSSLAAHDMSALAIPSGAADAAALVVMSLANGLAEETVMRAYLIPRFEQLFGGTAVALLMSTLLFAAYHAYQGPAGIISAAAVGLVYGGVFCISRRLWPIALAHAFQDVLGIAMLHR